MQDRRRYLRTTFREPVQYSMLGEGAGSRHAFGGFLSCDVSEGGLRIYANDFVPLNTPVKMDFYIHPEKLVSLDGRVVWTQKAPHTENYQLGMEFDENNTNFNGRGDLRQYVHSLQF